MDMLLGTVAFLIMAFLCNRIYGWNERAKERSRIERAEKNILAREQARKNINAKRNKKL